MVERPILFSAPMVLAILAGKKTVTRRVVKRPIKGSPPAPVEYQPGWWDFGGPASDGPAGCPYGQPGDRLWVRETWGTPPSEDAISPRNLHRLQAIRYAADGVVRGVSKRFVDAEGRFAIGRDRPSIHMPRWASRLTLEVLSVRVERLHGITEEDAIAEGIPPPVPVGPATAIGGPDYRFIAPGVLHTSVYGDQDREAPAYHSARDAFAALWASINGADSWDANPWVWRVEFKRIDQVEAKAVANG
jgi:hypothetical protein